MDLDFYPRVEHSAGSGTIPAGTRIQLPPAIPGWKYHCRSGGLVSLFRYGNETDRSYDEASWSDQVSDFFFDLQQVRLYNDVPARCWLRLQVVLCPDDLPEGVR